MTLLRTAVVALSLLLLGTPAIEAESDSGEPSSSPSVQSTPAPQATPSPTAAPLTESQRTDRLRHAIEQAAVYLGSHQLTADQLWIATQGAILLGPGFKAWARTLAVDPALVRAGKRPPLKTPGDPGPALGRMLALRALPPRPIAALPRPKITPVANATSRLYDEETTGDLILVGVLSTACRDQPPDLHAKWLKLFSPDKHNYLLTAQLFGIMLAYNQGCVTSGVVKPIRQQLATRTFRELREDIPALDDLAIQRIAALCYASVCEWIDPELIDRLVSEQEPAGSWGRRDPNLRGLYMAMNDHTAANAFYALARTWSLRHASSKTPGPMAPPSK